MRMTSDKRGRVSDLPGSSYKSSLGFLSDERAVRKLFPYCPRKLSRSAYEVGFSVSSPAARAPGWVSYRQSRSRKSVLVHRSGSYLWALSVPSSFSRLIHEPKELFSVNKGATLVAMASIPRSSYMCRRTSVRGSRMWTRPLTEGARPWSWFAIASKSRPVERSEGRMIAHCTL